MIKKVTQFCRQEHLLEPGDGILVGLSGGADSVCLFLVLMAMKQEWNLRLFPVHVHHNLRGEEADADERFCRSLCEKYGVSLTTVSVRVAGLAEENGWSVEEAGRNARYETFERLKKKWGCQKIAVAHHKNDQAETVLFQLLRGSRMKGLSGIPAGRGTVIRPLLCVTRQEIEEFLRDQGQEYCTDRTNLEDGYTRNRIRNRMIPLAEQIQPKAVEHIAATADYLSRVEKLLERQSRELWRQAVVQEEKRWKISVPILQKAEPLLAERVVYRVLCEAAGEKKDMTALAVTQCMALFQKQTGRSMELPKNVIAVREYDTVWVERKRDGKEAGREQVTIAIREFPCTIPLLREGKKLHLELWDRKEDEAAFDQKRKQIPKNDYTKWYDYDTINNDMVLRTPRTGDRIALYTDGRGKNVLSVLVEAKIPKEERNRRAVLAAGEDVLWIPGVRSSEAHRVSKDTERILAVTIEK